jgi:hypothetical protein
MGALLRTVKAWACITRLGRLCYVSFANPSMAHVRCEVTYDDGKSAKKKVRHAKP